MSTNKMNTNKMNSEDKTLKSLKLNIKNEIRLHNKLINKLFVVNNVYVVSDILNKKNKNNIYHLELRIESTKNQNNDLLNHVNNLLHRYPNIIKFLFENFKLNNPLSISLYFTKDYKPIILVNKRGFHLVDFNAILTHSNRRITPLNFSFSLPQPSNKLF